MSFLFSKRLFLFFLLFVFLFFLTGCRQRVPVNDPFSFSELYSDSVNNDFVVGVLESDASVNNASVVDDSVVLVDDSVDVDSSSGFVREKTVVRKNDYYEENSDDYEDDVVVPVNDDVDLLINDSVDDNIPVNNSVNDSAFTNGVLFPGVSWYLQFTGVIDYGRDEKVYFLDLFETPSEKISELKAEGKVVICYFSAGTVEDYRPDAGDFPVEVVGNVLGDWPDERWLDVSRFELFSDVMLKRLDLAKSKGCDGVDADNVDSFINDNGFSVDYDDQLSYNKWLSEEAHKRGLLIGLKNDLLQVSDLVDYFDFAVNEQCFYYDECSYLVPFIDAGKPVFNIEYDLDKEDFCSEARDLGFSSVKATLSLDGYFDPC